MIQNPEPGPTECAHTNKSFWSYHWNWASSGSVNSPSSQDESVRISYAGLFSTGYAAAKLGRYYASAIADSGVEFDMLFGPAYKGIPLTTLAAAALAEHHDVDVPYAFNRKEAKGHGEGGNIVGAPLAGKVLIVDDVITAGTAVREAQQIITSAGAKVAGLVISLDRQEIGKDSRSAVQDLEQHLGIPVISIVQLDDLIELLEETGEFSEFLQPVTEYRKQYGA